MSAVTVCLILCPVFLAAFTLQTAPSVIAHSRRRYQVPGFRQRPPAMRQRASSLSLADRNDQP